MSSAKCGIFVWNLNPLSQNTHGSNPYGHNGVRHFPFTLKTFKFAELRFYIFDKL